MATFTPKINLPKPVPDVETDWAFRLNEGIEILDDAMLTTNVSGVGSITVTDDGSGNVTISGTDEVGEGSSIPNALVGSDGITVTSGDPTDDIAGFRGEFINASGTLQTDIDTNTTNIATNVSDIVDNTTLITTTSGHLQSEIDAVDASDTDTVSDAMVGTDGITVLSGTPTASETTISGFRDEFLSASGTLVKKTGDTMTGDLLITNDAQITIPLGSASAPSIIFEGDPDTGIASQGSNAILFVTGGESPVIFTSSTLFMLPRILSNLGSATAPQFSFLSSADTGMYGPSVGELAFTTGGVAAGRFDASQNFHANADVLASGTVSGTEGVITNTSNADIFLARKNTPGDGSQPGFAFQDDTDTGMQLDGVGDLRLVVGGVRKLAIQSGGVIPLAVVIHNSAGNAGTPVYSWNADKDTGLYNPSADVIGFTAGATETLTISGVNDSTDGVGIAGNLTVTGTVGAQKIVAVTGTFTEGLTIGTETTQITPDGIISTGLGEFGSLTCSNFVCSGDDYTTHIQNLDLHNKYTKENNDALIGGTNITVTSGSNTITIDADAQTITSIEVSATSSTNTTSATYVLITNMTSTPAAGTYFTTFSTTVQGTNTGQIMQVSLFHDGSIVQHTERDADFESGAQADGLHYPLHTQAILTFDGAQAVEARYQTNAGTLTAYERSLILIKLS